jgi:hypothetical protein
MYSFTYRDQPKKVVAPAIFCCQVIIRQTEINFNLGMLKIK